MQLMYIENKESGKARIGLVTFSKSYKTVYYGGRSLYKTVGYKYNHYDIKTGENFWISAPKKDGCDALYGRKRVVIDEDIRKEYWLNIRNLPENINLTEYVCEGKYQKRKPR